VASGAQGSRRISMTHAKFTLVADSASRGLVGCGTPLFAQSFHDARRPERDGRSLPAPARWNIVHFAATVVHPTLRRIPSEARSTSSTCSPATRTHALLAGKRPPRGRPSSVAKPHSRRRTVEEKYPDLAAAVIARRFTHRRLVGLEDLLKKSPVDLRQLPLDERGYVCRGRGYIRSRYIAR